MDGRAANDPFAELTAVLDWWREAGVDGAFADTPRQWLVAPEVAPSDGAAGDANGFPVENTLAAPVAERSPPRAMIGGNRAGWPRELAAFSDWWLHEASLDSGQIRDRVPPRGPEKAALMVLVPEPEAEDRDVLLSGRQGRLLHAMLAAMAVPAPQVYVASALPRHMPLADWDDLAARGLGEVLRHHLMLAQPQRIIGFGRHIPPLLERAGLASPREGSALPQMAPILHNISQEMQNVPLLVARDIGSLLERPIAKGHFWQQWLEWSAG